MQGRSAIDMPNIRQETAQSSNFGCADACVPAWARDDQHCAKQNLHLTIMDLELRWYEK
jgi:hypothetical protein